MPDTKKNKSKTAPKVQTHSQPKELYLANGLTQLNSNVDEGMAGIKRANFSSLCRSADKLWSTIDEPNNDGTHDQDQERAYIFLLRYIRVVRLVEKAAGESKFVYARFGTRLQNSVHRWKHLHNVLAERYKTKHESTYTSNTLAPTESNNMDAIIALLLEKQKDKPPMSPENQFIAKYLCDAKSTDPKCLYLLLQDKINILIVDIRIKAAFENSCIKCDATVINIDGDIIRKGMSTNTLGQMLPADIQPIFENRRKYDLLIVLDENSFPMSHVHAVKDNKLYIFLDIIGNWDLDSDRYPNGGPVILQGGFAGWMDHYPACCTNPQARFTPSGHTIDLMDTFLALEYPTFDYDTEKKTVMVIDRSTKPIYPKPVKKKPRVDDDDDDMESDPEESPYKDEIQFDAVSLRPLEAQDGDEDAVRKGLAHLAVLLRQVGKQRALNLRGTVAFRGVYDAMSVEERMSTGDAQLVAYVEALDAADKQVQELVHQRSKYVARFAYLAETVPPHGTITDRADQVFGIWQAHYERMLSDDNDSVAYVRDITKNAIKRKRTTPPSELNAAVTDRESNLRNAIIPPPVISIPKVPDRTFQPAAIWLPSFNSITDTITGLVNYHNNCFLNSTIQALRHVPTFYTYILTQNYKADMNRRKQQTKVQLLPQVAKIVEDLWKCNNSVLSAEKLYRTMLETCPIFEDWRHEDGLEVFTLVFNRICEETERPMRIQSQYDFYLSDKIEHWIRMHNRQISFLSQRFYYEIKRTRDCKMCNRKMITYDISNSMMLPLKLPNESGGLYTPSRLHLQDAVTAYMELPDQYKILCTKCKTMAIEYKEIKYYPEVAVINLKRYVSAGDTGSKTSIFRSDTVVSYPETKLKIGIASYRLNAIVCHSGTMDSGHYTALCLNPVDKKWYYYDDGHVTQSVDIHEERFRRKCYVFYYSLETEFQRLNLNFAKL